MELVSTWLGTTLSITTARKVSVSVAPGAIAMVLDASPSAASATSMVSFALVVVLTCAMLLTTGVAVPLSTTLPVVAMTTLLIWNRPAGITSRTSIWYAVVLPPLLITTLKSMLSPASALTAPAVICLVIVRFGSPTRTDVGGGAATVIVPAELGLSNRTLAALTSSVPSWLASALLTVAVNWM